MRMADLFANERNLLHQQNEELKRLNKALRESPSARQTKYQALNEGSALFHFSDQAQHRSIPEAVTFRGNQLSLEEAVQMLNVAHEKYAALQDQYLNLRSEITTLHQDLTNTEEKCSKLQIANREINYELERKRSLLAEKELQLAASIRLPNASDGQAWKGQRDIDTADQRLEALTKVTNAGFVESNENHQLSKGAFATDGVVSTSEMEFHKQIQELLEEVRLLSCIGNGPRLTFVTGQKKTIKDSRVGNENRRANSDSVCCW